MEHKLFYTMLAVLGSFTLVVVTTLYLFAHPLWNTPGATTELSVTPDSQTLASSPEVLGATTQVESFSLDKLYSLINAYRREKKLNILKAHPLLEKSAQEKLSDMQARKYWSHLDPQGRASWYFFDSVGYHYEHAGETISTGNMTPWKVFAAWTESPTHNAELVNPLYEHMGAAVDCSSYVTAGIESCVVVLHLGKQAL